MGLSLTLLTLDSNLMMLALQLQILMLTLDLDIAGLEYIEHLVRNRTESFCVAAFEVYFHPK